jgi:3-methyladenine DNA glycosylase AlkD
MVDWLQQELFQLQDKQYAAFQSKLLPSIDPKTIIGVRTPLLRTYAKKVANMDIVHPFLAELPHQYFDENQLHAFILSGKKDFDRCLEEVERFLPYIDNWATCDQLSPKIFKKHLDTLLPHIGIWLVSEHTYTIRFGIGMLMQYYLDDGFELKYPDAVAAVTSDEYYVNMMIAWYFATALAKQYESIMPYLKENRLDDWTHNKTIQKAIESYRIAPEQKEYLKTLKKRSLRRNSL